MQSIRSRTLSCLLAASAAALSARAVHAQSFNVDVGCTAGTNPLAAYGGAPAQFGFWNWAPPAGAAAGGVGLSSLTGAATPVGLTLVGNDDCLMIDHPGTVGGDEALMDDLQDVGGVGSAAIWTFHDLAADGYWLYTYAWAPDDPAFVTKVHVDGAFDPDQNIGGAWPGAQRYADTFALHFVVVAPGADLVVRVETPPGGGFGSVNGFQLVRSFGACDGEIHEYCVAKLNSAGCFPDIAAVGTPSATGVGFFHITASGVIPNQNGLLVYSVVAPAETPFAGSLLCIAPPLKRTMLQNSGGAGACGGTYDFDFNAHVTSTSADPALTIPGTPVWAQYYYRDVAHIDGTGVGLTNAVRFTMCF